MISVDSLEDNTAFAKKEGADFPILADLDLEKRINLDDLISRTYRFDEINEGFAALQRGETIRSVVVS